MNSLHLQSRIATERTDRLAANGPLSVATYQKSAVNFMKPMFWCQLRQQGPAKPGIDVACCVLVRH
ncbi:MAG: hypothetical protein K0S45_3768 [Nitrospira sp.]|nr:hypothetical protein [Nitrospira sp.]